MLESSSTLAYKCILKINFSPETSEGSNLFGVTMSYVMKYLENRFSLSINGDQFVTGQPYLAENESTYLKTAILKSETKSFDHIHWAAYIRARDSHNKRLTWVDHIGIEQFRENELTLYFAEYYSYHRAGSLTSPRLPQITTPKLIRDLLSSPVIHCVSGSCRLTEAPWLLMEDEVEEFLSLLRDLRRTIPIVVIACQDHVKLKPICAKTMGNLIICCINSFVSYAALCQQLPPEMQFPWGSIKIFMPLTIKNPYHTSISYQQISEMGAEGLAESLYQAFCTCLTASERKSFVTVDAIHEALKSRSLSELSFQNATLNTECSRLRQSNAELQAAQKELSDQCAALNSKLEQSEAPAYEELLSDTLAEIDKMKKCIALLTDRLCAHPKEPLSAEGLEECAEINDLALTLRTFQALFLS